MAALCRDLAWGPCLSPGSFWLGVWTESAVSPLGYPEGDLGLWKELPPESGSEPAAQGFGF